MIKDNCTQCKHFNSFRADYDDEMEPEWCGFCRLGMNDGYASEDLTCENFVQGERI